MNQRHFLLLMMPTLLLAGKTEDLKKEIPLRSPKRCQSSLFVCATAKTDTDNTPCLDDDSTLDKTQEKRTCLSQGQTPIICPTPIRHSPTSKTTNDEQNSTELVTGTTTPPILRLDEQGFFENLPINQDGGIVQKAESFSTNTVVPNAASEIPTSLPYNIKPYFFCALKKAQNKKPIYTPPIVPARHNKMHKTKKEVQAPQENSKQNTNTTTEIICCGIGIALQKKDSAKKKTIANF